MQESFNPSQEKNENIKKSLIYYTNKMCDQCKTKNGFCKICNINQLINLIKDIEFGRLPKHVRNIYLGYKKLGLVA